MGKTSIEWTGFSVNPLRARLNGATGYSSRTQPRFRMPQFQEQRNAGVEHFLDPKKLLEVLKRKKPTKFFWCDMTDMFGEWVPNEWIAACFGVMAATPHHTHQVLTKRAARLPEWFRWLGERDPARVCGDAAYELGAPVYKRIGKDKRSPWNDYSCAWPLPNVHLGVSVENQATADERIPFLLQAPAAVRFISAEPLLGPVRIDDIPDAAGGIHKPLVGLHWVPTARGMELRPASKGPQLGWVIIGSESGPGARPMEVSWARSIVDQCVTADVPIFVKQIATAIGRANGDRKGGKPEFWPPGEWPRQFPNEVR